MNNTVENTLKWRFDVSTFRLIGRELITDRITALFELVKNCYDANAKNVYVEFYNVGTKNADSKIIIKDDGIGMALSDIKDKWMVVGTSSKRKETRSPAPFNRRYVGEKGIGRFAVDKLGGKVLIKTKRKGEKNYLDVSINWEVYEKLESQPQLSLFTDVENSYSYSPAESPELEGTKLEISEVREIWSQKDIEKLYRELTKIVTPYFPPDPPFDIFIYSNEHEDELNNKKVVSDAVSYASTSVSIDYNKAKRTQESMVFNAQMGEIEKVEIPFPTFGPIKLQIHYFNPEAKKKYNNVYKDADRKIDGIKIYRDGLITTPFAEFEDHRDRKRDVLGIDKRLWRDIFNKVSSRDIIGILELTKENNPNIIDSTNRQNFVENQEYSDLKEFIISQLDAFSELKKLERDNKKKQNDQGLEEAIDESKSFLDDLEGIANENPQLRTRIEQVKLKAKKVTQSIKRGVIDKKATESEYIRKENIYLSLMSLQEYAAHVAHAVRTSLGKIKRKAEFFKDRYPDPYFENLFIKYSVDIFFEMKRLNKAIDFMLSYAGTTIEFEDIEFKDLIKTFFEQYENRFELDNVKFLYDIDNSCIITCNRKFIEDVLENLVDNSLKAFSSSQKQKIIKCSTEVDTNQIILYFSDNGCGIPQKDVEKVFDIFFTTTADVGGAGLGLYIAKTRIEALKGSIQIVESEYQPGVTFKITVPFNK